jgi:hypothetical protein
MIFCIRKKPTIFHVKREIAGITVGTGDNGFVGCLFAVQHFVLLAEHIATAASGKLL